MRPYFDDSAAVLPPKISDLFVPILERWLRKALETQALGSACVIWAHLAYRLKNRRPEELGNSDVMTLLVRGLCPLGALL